MTRNVAFDVPDSSKDESSVESSNNPINKLLSLNTTAPSAVKKDLWKPVPTAVSVNDLLCNAVGTDAEFYVNLEELHSDYVPRCILDHSKEQSPAPRASFEERQNGTLMGFFPHSAVFLDNNRVLLLSGSVVGNLELVSVDLEDHVAKWSDVFSVDVGVPADLFHNQRSRGARFGTRFVLRHDGAVVGIHQGVLCIVPQVCDPLYTRLAFRDYVKNYRHFVVPDFIRSKLFVYVIASYMREAGKPYIATDLLMVSMESGKVRVVTDTPVEPPRKELPDDGIDSLDPEEQKAWSEFPGLAPNFHPSTLMELPSGHLILAGSIYDQSDPSSAPTPAVYKGVLTRQKFGQRCSITWFCTMISTKQSDTRLGVGTSIASSTDRKCILAGTISDEDIDGAPFSVSDDHGTTWSKVRSFNQRLFSRKHDSSPPLLAFSPSNKLFAFAYDKEDDKKRDENLSLVNRGRSSEASWPCLNVYKWAGYY